MEIKAPTEFCKPSVTVIEDTSELLYVGCGKKGRHITKRIKKLVRGLIQNGIQLLTS